MPKLNGKVKTERKENQVGKKGKGRRDQVGKKEKGRREGPK